MPSHPSNLVFLTKSQQEKFSQLRLDIFYVDRVGLTSCVSVNSIITNFKILPSSVEIFEFDICSRKYIRFSSPEEMEFYKKALPSAELSHFCFEIGLEKNGIVVPNKTLIIDTRTGDEIRKLVDEFVDEFINRTVEEIFFNHDSREMEDSKIPPPLVSNIDAWYFNKYNLTKDSILLCKEKKEYFALGGNSRIVYDEHFQNAYAIMNFILHDDVDSEPFLFLKEDESEISTKLKTLMDGESYPYLIVERMNQ